MTDAFVPSARSKVKRLPKRAHYDRATVNAILDAGFICHVGYAIDGQPYVTPTAYWREGDAVYWHGSTASRMLRTPIDDERLSKGAKMQAALADLSHLGLRKR